jgi:hypothetical protein
MTSFVIRVGRQFYVCEKRSTHVFARDYNLNKNCLMFKDYVFKASLLMCKFQIKTQIGQIRKD